MPDRRAISMSLALRKVGQSKVGFGTSQPKPRAISNSRAYSLAKTMNFFGTQPRMTQVPPTRCSSATATRAPDKAASRAARTPPDPAPITKRS